MRDEQSGKHTGILGRLKTFLDRSRVGELLVIKGLITPSDLRHALSIHKQTHQPLGQVLIANEMISRTQLTRVLSRQMILRCTTAFVMCVLSLSSIGSKRARADVIKDVPAKIAFNTASGAYGQLGDVHGLFGTSEKRSTNLAPFTKWAGMFSRMDRQLATPSGQQAVKEMQSKLEGFKNLPLRSMAERVNTVMNQEPYIVDSRNWGQSDYWETPMEFMQRGGDCEDFAIAKYVALRALGVPEERMRVVIVQDTYKNIPHAILALYTDDGVVVLDNQNKSLVDGESAGRYKPIFSINREAWWLHTSPDATQIASR